MRRRAARIKRPSRKPPKSGAEVVANLIEEHNLTQIEQLAAAIGCPPNERTSELRMTVDRVELELIGSMYVAAVQGNAEAAKFLLSTKFGYSATGPTQPIKVGAKVVIKTDKAPP